MSEYLNTLIPAVAVPPAISGLWRVEQFAVSEEAAQFDALRNAIRGERRAVPAGRYTRLKRGGVLVMSDTPAEKRDHARFVNLARGHVLINGLGLGMVAQAVLRKPAVESLTIVEKSADVIALVGASLGQDARLRIVQADALTWKPPPAVQYDYVWHDIWNYICADNLDEMKRLHRRFGRRAGWQGSWARELCELARGRGR